jgi:superfamily II DNA or RNA helicase
LCGIDVGVIQGEHDKTDIGKQVQIATPQTIKRRFTGRNEAIFKNYRVDLLIVDECHIKHTGIMEAANHWGCPVLGLTATPYTKGLGLFYDSVIQPIKLDALIDQGYLAPYKVFSHNAPSMKGVKTSGGDYVAKQAAAKYDAGIIGSVVHTWLMHGNGRKTLGFASTVASAQAFSDMFKASGIDSDFTSGYLDSDDAIERLDKFRHGDTMVLWNVQKLTKGFDMPQVSCIVDCAPTKSLSLHIQKCGRAIRIHDDKEFALMLDHAGNFIRNGMLEDAHIDSLDIGEGIKDRPNKEKLPKPCPKCGMLKNTQICGNCGFKTEPKADIETQAGTLVELTRTQKKHNKDMTPDQKAEFYGGLKKYSMDKGYKLGWASHKYKSKMGVWPNKYASVPLVEPNAMVLGFIKHENIRNAHRRK